MTVKISELREKIGNIARQSRALVDSNPNGLSADQQTQFDNWMDEIDRTENAIKNQERIRALDAEKFFDDAVSQAKKGGGEISAKEAVAIWMRQGLNVNESQAVAIRNAMSTTTSSEGGYTVPSEIAAMVVDALKAYGGMRSVAQILTTDSGNSLSYPTSDGTSEVGEIVAENGAATGADITFGTVAVNPHKYSSKKIALPIELVQDSAIDIIAFTTNRLAERLARITNQHYTTGTGTGQPYGLTARASTGKTGTTGQTATVTYDDLIDLIHSVNSAYRQRGAMFMLSDSSLKVIRKIKDSTGLPIWRFAGDESISGGAPSTICGERYTINDDMPAMAANAKSIAFGDFSQFVIRDVRNSMSIRRFDDSAFALNGQIGFCGWMRTGSNLLDTAAVKLYVNSAT